MSTIREMTAKDKPIIIDMMRAFYSSPAVLSNGSTEIFNADIDACLSDSPYLEGYVFEEKGKIQGYTRLTEFG